MCASHTDLKFAFEDLCSNIKQLQLPPPPVSHYIEMVEYMLCPEEPDDLRTRNCIKGDCNQCGLKDLDEHFFNPLASVPPQTTVSFRSVEKDAAGRLGVQIKSDRSPAELIQHVKEKLAGFPLHRFVAKTQKVELDKLLTSLDLDHLVIVSDFAEKFTPHEFEEVQSLHWSGQSFTIFTSVAYCNAYDPGIGSHKKIKVYFAFISVRPEQDHYMVSHCLSHIVKWLFTNLSLSFKSMTFASDRCAAQFCSRKVFGSLSESRRHLCVDHQSTAPLCPNCPCVSIHFSGAGHGKCEVDHVGALFKTSFRKEELAKRPLRTIDNIATHLPKLNYLDLSKTPPGKEDSKGFFLIGMHGEVVKTGDVSVSSLDWERIEGTRDLHQLITTSKPGELLIRESSCFSCASCEFGDFVNCTRTDELGSVKSVAIQRLSSSFPSARAATRTRAGQDRHRHDTAELAEIGSIIAIARGESQEINFILVTKPMGQLSHKDLLQGKVLEKTAMAPNHYSSTGAKMVSFHAELVRSPPLLHQKLSMMVEGREKRIIVIEEFEFNGLVSEYY